MYASDERACTNALAVGLSLAEVAGLRECARRALELEYRLCEPTHAAVALSNLCPFRPPQPVVLCEVSPVPTPFPHLLTSFLALLVRELRLRRTAHLVPEQLILLSDVLLIMQLQEASTGRRADAWQTHTVEAGGQDAAITGRIYSCL